MAPDMRNPLFPLHNHTLTIAPHTNTSQPEFLDLSILGLGGNELGGANELEGLHRRKVRTQMVAPYEVFNR